MALHQSDNNLASTSSDFEFVNTNTGSGNQTNLLGVGSFGAVKLAKNKRTNQLYAIKMVQLTNTSARNIENLQREIRVHSDLNHPHIIKFHSHFKTSNMMFIVLEYAENGNLYSLLHRKKKFSEPDAFIFFYQTALALNHLHENDIVHRDLKPENLLLDKNFAVKLCDFGWCTEGTNYLRKTFCGTYEYMAPEIVNKLPYDYHVDVWGLGVLLYELLHGYSPFKGKSYPEISKKIKENNINFSAAISQEAKDLIMRILQVNPVDRVGIPSLLNHVWVAKMKKESNYSNRFADYERDLSNDQKSEFSRNVYLNDFSRSVSPISRKNQPSKDYGSSSAIKSREASVEKGSSTSTAFSPLMTPVQSSTPIKDGIFGRPPPRAVSPSPVNSSNKQENSYFLKTGKAATDRETKGASVRENPFFKSKAPAEREPSTLYNLNFLTTPTKSENKENEVAHPDMYTSGGKSNQDRRKMEGKLQGSLSKTQDFKTGIFADVSNMTEDQNPFRKSNSKIFSKINNEKNKEVIKNMGNLMKANTVRMIDFEFEDKVTDEENIKNKLLSPTQPGRGRPAPRSGVDKNASMIEEEDGISPFLHLETKMGVKFKRL